MKTVGLTGGIGSGKSTVAKALQVLGYPCYDSDSSMKALYRTDRLLQKEMEDIWGNGIFTDDGQGHLDIDRQAFSKILFSDAHHQELLAQIAYPRLREDFIQWREHHPARLVFFESAVLMEKTDNFRYDILLAVCAPEEERIERALRRPGMTRGEIVRRILSQPSDEELERIADFVLVNDGKRPILPQLNLFLTQYSS